MVEDNMEVKEDLYEEDPAEIGSCAVSYSIYDKRAPIFGRIGVALIIAELLIELFPYIYNVAELFMRGNLYVMRIKAAALALALSTFSRPLFVGALIVSLVSIIKDERRAHAYFTLITLAVVLCYFISTVLS